jgi:hypothetical protein
LARHRWYAAAKAVDVPAMKLLLEKHADIDGATIDGKSRRFWRRPASAPRDSDTRGRYRTQKDAIEAVDTAARRGRRRESG